MIGSDFDKIVEARIVQCMDVLNLKGEEYASGGDKLSNFKSAAAMKGTNPQEALMGMWVKHLVALFDFVRDRAEGKLQPKSQWEEKITDSINYLLLLEALMVELGGWKVMDESGSSRDGFQKVCLQERADALDKLIENCEEKGSIPTSLDEQVERTFGTKGSSEEKDKAVEALDRVILEKHGYHLDKR